MSIAAKNLIFVCVLLTTFAATKPSFGEGAIVRPRNPSEPAWSGRVIPVGEEREKIKSTPIPERPNRVGHFYGNTIRRAHFRGTAVPLPRDVINMTYSFVARP